MKDIINLLTTEKDVASGQHVPAGEAMWSYPSMADDKKKKNVEKDFVNELGNPIKIEIKEITDVNPKSQKEFNGLNVIMIGPDSTSENVMTLKEAIQLNSALNEYFGIYKKAMGLTDIPASTNGGEILDFQGIPQNPGLSRELGDGEELDFFGAASDVDEIPPINDLSKKIESRKKRINSLIKNINNEQDRVYSGVFMNKRARVSKLKEIRKSSGIAGGSIGGMAGATIFNLLPVVNLLPAPIRIMLGSGVGSQIEEYLQKDTQAKTRLELQSNQLIDLQTKLKTYGVNDSEISKLSVGQIKPEQLADIMITRGAKLPFAWKAPLQKLAQSYVIAATGLTSTIENIQKQAVPDPQPKNQSRTTPATSRVPQGHSSYKNVITRPGDPFTYSKNPSGEGYIIISAPQGKEHVIGRIIKPGAPGFNEVQAADLAQSKEDRAPLFTAAERKLNEAKQTQDQTLFREAAELYKQSYDKSPSANALFNAAKAFYEAGMADTSVELFAEYKTKYPDEWEKNIGLIPDFIKNKYNPAITTPEAITEPETEVDSFSATSENIQQVLSKFLQGVPIRVQTADGTTTTMDSGRVRKLTTRYIKDISGSDEVEGLGLTTTGIVEEFGPSINDGVLKAKERGVSAEQLKGIFNGLVWQALRRAWAKWKGKSPTEKQQLRRLNKIEKQDERVLDKAEKTLRRENAKRMARQYLIETIYKSAI